MPSRCSWSNKKLRSRRSREVERDCLGRNAKLALKFLGKLREPVRTAGHENNVVMIFGEELGQFVSDAAGGAGDESGLIRSGWGLAHAFTPYKNRVPRPSRVLCERAGLLGDLLAADDRIQDYTLAIAGSTS